MKNLTTKPYDVDVDLLMYDVFYSYIVGTGILSKEDANTDCMLLGNDDVDMKAELVCHAYICAWDEMYVYPQQNDMYHVLSNQYAFLMTNTFDTFCYRYLGEEWMDEVLDACENHRSPDPFVALNALKAWFQHYHDRHTEINK